MIDFESHLNQASEIVSSWPEWKQAILGGDIIRNNTMKRLPVGFIPKGWGYESIIVNKPEYCGKILFFKKGKKCSWHYHKIKDEVFYLQSGKLLVRYGDGHLSKAKEVILEPGDCLDIPPGLRHQMEGLEDSFLIEFSTTHSEEDSIRVVKGD